LLQVPAAGIGSHSHQRPHRRQALHAGDDDGCELTLSISGGAAEESKDGGSSITDDDDELLIQPPAPNIINDDGSTRHGHRHPFACSTQPLPPAAINLELTISSPCCWLT
jgi:hypothetical protein